MSRSSVQSSLTWQTSRTSIITTTSAEDEFSFIDLTKDDIETIGKLRSKRRRHASPVQITTTSLPADTSIINLLSDDELEISSRKRRRLQRSATMNRTAASLTSEASIVNNSGPSATRLCKRCCGLDMAVRLHRPCRQFSGQQVVELNDLHHQDVKTRTCDMCAMFRKLRPSAKQSKTYILMAYPGNAIVKRPMEQARATNNAGLFFAIYDPLAMGDFARRDALLHGVLAPVTGYGWTREAGALQARLINREACNYTKMQRWMNRCHRYHKRTCGKETPRLVTNLRCIDCITEEIVDVPQDASYYALSYVWGPASMSTAMHRGRGHGTGSKLASSVPQVIRDAITVVKGLGERYLWVDRYCINQANSRDVHLQVSLMDRIFEGARATLVAAASQDQNQGLPGVSRPRKEQPLVCVDNARFASTLPQLPLSIKDEKWATRGWCYQEAVLSRRCFFFTEHQVYFVCRSMSCCESYDLNFRCTQQAMAHGEPRTDIFMHDETKVCYAGDSLWTFFANLCAYKKRSLTYTSDMLNAFRGILARSGMFTVWGIPMGYAAKQGGRGGQLDKEFCIEFARGLWWEPACDSKEITEEYAEDANLQSFRRIKPFPSWSWAGWSGPVQPHLPTELESGTMTCNRVRTASFDTKFWLMTEMDQTAPLTDVLSLAEVDGTISVLPRLLVESNVYRVRLCPVWGLQGALASVCGSQGSDTCEGRHSSRGFNVRLFRCPSKKRLLSLRFSAVELFRRERHPGRRAHVQCFLVDKVDDKMEVFGVGSFDEATLRDAPHVRRKVELY